ncbi:MAG: hypothetical protein ACR2GH_15995 [Pseudonocardia sp.]
MGLVLELQELDLDGIDITVPFIGDRSSGSTLDCNLESALSGGGCNDDDD